MWDRIYGILNIQKGVIHLKKGTITHYYDKLGVGIIKLSSGLKLGDSLTIKNKQGDDIFTQDVSSMQVDHKEVSSAKKGDELGVKLEKSVQKGWLVYA
jgi:U32 family peptidase